MIKNFNEYLNENSNFEDFEFSIFPTVSRNINPPKFTKISIESYYPVEFLEAVYQKLISKVMTVSYTDFVLNTQNDPYLEVATSDYEYQFGWDPSDKFWFGSKVDLSSGFSDTILRYMKIEEFMGCLYNEGVFDSSNLEEILEFIKSLNVKYRGAQIGSKYKI